MPTAIITHPACFTHDTGAGHPETGNRLSAINDHLVMTGLADVLRHVQAPEVSEDQLLRVHTKEHLENIESMIPETGYARLDPDTVISQGSLDAARRAAGAAVEAVNLVMDENYDSAFCAVRPPGHHAERQQAMGFCLYNNIAVGAAHALASKGLGRIAIVDFDVHHGNGTEDIFKHDERVLFCSTFQHPFFPYTRLLENNINRVSVPLAAGAKSEEFRDAVTNHWVPAIQAFEPEMMFISAGFDAHRDDDMSSVSLTDADYVWVTEQIVQLANTFAGGRMVSVLEGGYELESLARCVDAHLRVVMGIR